MGVLAGIAVDAGELRSDDSLRSWLPALPRWTESATIAQLLHHTSGLPRELSSRTEARSATSVMAAIKALKEPTSPPGTRFEYSNDGYFLLAAILERAAGIPIGQLGTERVFIPLGMNSSHLSRHAHLSPAGEPAPPSTIGDGGWWTTVADVGRLLRHLNQDPSGTRLMHTGHLLGGETVEYGWGVRVLRIGGLLAASHGGSWQRWQSKTLRIPERECAVVVAARTDDTLAVSDLGTKIAATVSKLR